jgi:uncharacterized protein (DUF697 family)
MVQKVKESKPKESGGSGVSESASGESGESGVSESASGSGEMTDSPRDQRALEVVNRYSMWSGAAGFIPIPLLDVATVGGVQLMMLRRLSEIYEVPFSENRGKSVIASLAGSVLPASTATTGAMTVGSLVKGLPVVGWVVGAVTMPALSAGATYVVGKVFIEHFASGGTLLDFNLPDYREFIKVQKEKLAAGSAAATASAQPGPAAQSASEKTAADA